jgi:hypothetical protein
MYTLSLPSSSPHASFQSEEIQYCNESSVNDDIRGDPLPPVYGAEAHAKCRCETLMSKITEQKVPHRAASWPYPATLLLLPLPTSLSIRARHLRSFHCVYGQGKRARKRWFMALDIKQPPCRHSRHSYPQLALDHDLPLYHRTIPCILSMKRARHQLHRKPEGA